MSLVGAAMTGDRPALEELQDRLGLEIDDCRTARGLAALSLRFIDVMQQIDTLTDSWRRGVADEIADRRAARRSARRPAVGLP